MADRKLAEIWLINGTDYHLRVEVGAFQRALTPDPVKAEEIASYEVIEVLRRIIEEADANRLRYRSEPK